jgi:phenylacetate-coenzyme A ligase PaaK-like adenylate-forming protein
MQKMNLESIQSKISFLESETMHRKKLHEEEILKLRRVSDELYENIQTYESMIV